MVIASACAEIWATQNIDELRALADKLNADYLTSLNASYTEAFDAETAYFVAADHYRERYVATINAVLDFAGQAGNQSLYAEAWAEGAEPHMPQSEFDQKVDAAVEGSGTDILVHDILSAVEDLGISVFLETEHQAKLATIEARRKLLVVEGKIAGIEAVIEAVRVCADGQRDYLEGRAPDPAA